MAPIADHGASPTIRPRQQALSMSSVSSRTSSLASSNLQYPSSITTLATPTTSNSISPIQDIYADGQFDIIDNLDYDDVDDALIDHELVHRNRETLVQQLYASEQAYLQSLSLIMHIFFQPLRKGQKSSSFKFLSMKKTICTEKEMRWLFGNLEEIYQVHQHILQSLEERLKIWGPTQIISDVLLTWFSYLKCYHVYLDNYDVAVTTYERLTRYEPFKKFIDSAHKDATLKGATLLSLLQIPAGCVSRYAQLMSKLADATTPMHPDYAGLRKCKKRILSLAEQIKIKVDDCDNVDQVLMIHQALVGAPFGVRAQRRLILQGQLSDPKANGEDRTYLLFSDLLVVVRPKQEMKRMTLQYKGQIHLERAKIRALPLSESNGGCPYGIEITSSFQGVDTLNTTFMGTPTVHIIYASNEKEQEEWLKLLTMVIEKIDRADRARIPNKRLAQSRSPPESLRRQTTNGTSSASSKKSSLSHESSDVPKPSQ
ncbi:Dbl homology domain-containing protein [Radiomyces spectabilis]|uniref:Dbl homology domain-containing protein n=1 Tax=Radiomyces spectabilis TaxID=64574 RepID=UPI00221FA045|nr:Dbl homology domain-containing protein [Radiomyces spectabilis]KAI8393644.1 Dbl homology domain-containing protein [Radiomyces spectabilis]